MTLNDYVTARGRGALTKLMRRTGLAYPTILAAAKGSPVRYGTARKISLATDGEVGVDDLVIDGADAVLPGDEDEDDALVAVPPEAA